MNQNKLYLIDLFASVIYLRRKVSIYDFSMPLCFKQKTLISQSALSSAG